MYFELDGLSLNQLIGYFEQISVENEYADSELCEVAYRIRLHGKPGKDFIWQELQKPDNPKLGGLIFGITCPTHFREGIIPLTLDEQAQLHDILFVTLKDKRPMIVAEAIDGLTFLNITDAFDQILRRQFDESPLVRGAVLRYMSRLFPKQAIPLLLDALNDPHFIVRENAVDELDDLDAKTALPELRKLLNDDHPDVRQAAATAIRNLESD
jgi:hypothetical protein